MNRPHAAAALVLLALPAAPVVADDPVGFCKVKQFTVRAGEVTRGDRYFAADSLSVAGRHEGDLVGGVRSGVISGEVSGDVALIGSTIDVSGHVEDTVRVWGQSISVSGRIDGDLVAFAGSVNIHPQGHVRGNVIVFSGTLDIHGTVDGELRATAGEIVLNGVVARDARLKADAISFGADARIGGNLTYTTREALEPTSVAAVTGTTSFHDRDEQREEEEEDDRGLTLGRVVRWCLWLVAAILVGFVGLGLSRRGAAALAARVGSEAVLSTLVGFGAFLVVPAAAVMAIVLIVPAALGVIALLLFTIVLYLAKMPVALWLGQRLLGLTGGRLSSPFLALALGLVLLNLAYSIPFWLGFLVRLGTTWLGLGAILLAARGLADARARAGS